MPQRILDPCAAIAADVRAAAAFIPSSAQPGLSLQQSVTATSTLVPPVRPFRLPPRIGVETQKRRFSLEQALAMALANNKDIEASRIDRRKSDYTLTAARGVFDPLAQRQQLLGEANHSRSLRPWADRPPEAC